MNYSLAKELKDAGFPQIEVTYPTLEELVEACGDGLLALGRVEGAKNLVAWQVRPHPRTGLPDTLDGTPAEAVARLWLALNKKS